MELLNSLEIVKTTLQKRKALLILVAMLICLLPSQGLAGLANHSLPPFLQTHLVFLSDLLIYGLLGTLLLTLLLLWREKRLNRQLKYNKQAILTQLTQLQKDTEQLQRQNAELERANRLKSEFFANMSHELRTPLNAVLGITESLSEQIYGGLNDSQIESLNRIYHNGEQLLRLISDIVDLSKLEVGRVHLKYEQFNLYNFCMTCLAYVKERAHKKNIQIILEPDEDNDLGLIIADPRRLKQILFNLLSNAVKFTPEGHMIGLRVVKIPADDQQMGYIQFNVWDQGPGISLKQQAHIFEPFNEQYHQLQAKYKGTGLGLALVKQLTELHRGKVDLSSELGKGSCFTVTLPNLLTSTMLAELPADSSIAAEIAEVSAITQQARPPLILMVEDTPDHVTNVRDFLLHFGYEVEVAYSGEDALSFISHTRPDLILMDINMPHMDGFEVTKRIRQKNACQTIPIIALTAMTMSGDRERCLAVGMNDYVGKPFNIRKLVKIIEVHLQGKNT